MYDVIVVGARCAGSSVGLLLARRGYRVLIVDRATFPSDTFRNHFILRRGCRRLQAWGLLDRVAASNAAPVRRVTFHLGDFALSGCPPPTDGLDATYAPRRIVLDQLLVAAAAEAGAEVREGVVVEDVRWEDDRIAGIRGRTRQGSTFAERARLVVGADGQYSLVARRVGAATDAAHPPLTCGFYTYWRGARIDGLEVHLSFAPENRRIIIAFPTNDGAACVAVQWPTGDWPRVRADGPGAYWRVLDQVPELAERVRAAERSERWFAATDLANFVRVPAGPGWALVGDAGCHKDPVLAHGISDAFEQAELLAAAVDAGLSGREPLEAALARYRAERDAAMRSGYESSVAAAAFTPPPPEAFKLRAALRGNQADTDRFLGVEMGSLPPEAFYAPENLERILSPRMPIA